MEGFVDSCPQNLTEAINASTRLGCGRDKYGNDQYICLPNIEKSGLVELCHDGIMGIIQRGYCLETTERKLFQSNCTGFIEGCPDDPYRSNENYNYPACQQINTQYRCYLADPSCSITTHSLDLGVFNTTTINNQTATIQEYDSANIGAIVGGVCAGVIVLLLLFLGVLLWRRKHTWKTKRECGPECDINEKYTDSVHEFSCSAPLLPTNTTGDGGEGIPETGELEDGKHVFTKTSVAKKVFEAIEADIISKQEKKTNDVTEAGVKSNPEEKIHGVTEAGVNSIPGNVSHCDIETVNSKPEETVSGLQNIGINSEPEEKEHDDINTNSEKRSHGNAETSVKPEGKTYKSKEA
ncbi:uncharacterized protein LOC134236023, partial [Saccostrea cucullata]|uniref:uncharacterized protein LOC134236023 n=1 Tax=Saccostrea cuccullata TaxID=36930 RepID=UPI002ED04C5E